MIVTTRLHNLATGSFIHPDDILNVQIGSRYNVAVKIDFKGSFGSLEEAISQKETTDIGMTLEPLISLVRPIVIENNVDTGVAASNNYTIGSDPYFNISDIAVTQVDPPLHIDTRDVIEVFISNILGFVVAQGDQYDYIINNNRVVLRYNNREVLGYFMLMSHLPNLQITIYEE